MDEMTRAARAESPFRTDFILQDTTATTIWHMLRMVEEGCSLLAGLCDRPAHVLEQAQRYRVMTAAVRDMLKNAYDHSMNAALLNRLESISDAALADDP